MAHGAVVSLLVARFASAFGLLSACTAAAAPPQPPASAAPAEDGNWTMPGKNAASTRFSGLDELNAQNVGGLRVEFAFSTGVLRGHEAAPIVQGDTMYLITPYPTMASATMSALCVVGLTCFSGQSAHARELKVCADPNNLPFSNQREQGFENKLARLIADELHAELKYVWWAQRRGNVRETLKAGLCDVIPGVASNLETLSTTRPYYRSCYVFVTRAADRLELQGFDDPRLRTLTIGVQMVGDDSSNTPPAHALARRGVIDNVRGYMLYGDYAQDSPARAIIDDVARRRLDLAVVWGPVAGYFAERRETRLHVQAVRPLIDGPIPMVFDISMGVRKDDRALRRELDEALVKQATHIQALLRDYGIPIVAGSQLTLAEHR